MKKEIPKPVFFAIAAILLVGLGFFVFRNAGGPPEFAQPTNINPGIPDYIKNSMNEKDKAALAKGGIDVNTTAPSGGAPAGGPPSNSELQKQQQPNMNPYAPR